MGEKLRSAKPNNEQSEVITADWSEVAEPEDALELATAKSAEAEAEEGENLREDIAFDTAESLAVKGEKLKKGIKVVIGGPPHSGKSVFIDALTQNLNKDNTFLFSAAPDGEGPWLQRYYDDPDVVKLRQKGKFTPEFVADRKQKIADWEGPLMLIDVGGRTSAENAEMIQGATHAIVLAGDLSKVAEWRNFFEANNIDVVAKLHSHYAGNNDLQLPPKEDNGNLVGSVHHLERGESAIDHETVIQVAQLLTRLSESNEAYRNARSGEHTNPNELQVADFFADLPTEVIERTIRDREGNEKVIQNRQLLRSSIPLVYEKAKKHGEFPAWINGPLNSWSAIAMTLAFEEAGSEDVRLRSPDGYVQVKTLAESPEADQKWWEEPKLVGNHEDGRPIYVVHNTAHAANNPITPQDLDTMTVPKLPEDAVVVISTQGPNWLKSSIASGYRGKVSSIAAFVPGEGGTVAWAKDRDELGEVVK